jgi:glycosyltransferase involved in cell wall biosynthesis
MADRRLLLMTPATGYGGAEKYMEWIAAAARERHWQVTLACEDAAPLRPLVRACEEVGCEVVHAALAEPVPLIYAPRMAVARAVLRCLWLYRKVRPDVIHLTLPYNTLGFASVLAAALAGIPAVVVFQLIWESAVLGPRTLRAYRWARRRRQTWVGVSESYRPLLCQQFQCAPTEIQVIYNGSDTARLPDPATKQRLRSEVRAAHGIDDATCVLLAVGRACPQKGFDCLIRALAELKRRDGGLRRWVCAIAGDGPQRDELIELARQSGVAESLRFLGFVENVGAWHAAADLFVIPSRYDAVSFALSEAMVSGLPVIATQFASAQEAIEPGVSGLVVPVDDSRALAEAIAWAWSHPERMHAIAEEGRRTAWERFSRDKMCTDTFAALEAVMHSGARRPKREKAVR